MNAIKTVSVSVVIPCFRCKDTIGRAIASVVAQTEVPAEVIAVDDHSGDGTLEELFSLQGQYGEDWLKVVPLGANAGAAAARNAGWDLASSSFIAFLDADDSWHPQKIAIQRQWMNDHPEFALTGHASLVTSHTIANQVFAAPFEGAVPVSAASLLLSNQFSTPTVMLRRNLAQRFDGSKRRGEDYLLWMEVCLADHPMGKFPQRLAYIHKARFGAGGLSGNLLAMQHGEIDAYRKLWRAGKLNGLAFGMLFGYSWLKYLRRVAIAKWASPRHG